MSLQSNRFVYMFTVMGVTICFAAANADTISVTHTTNGSYTIPKFNQSLGTLTGVQLVYSNLGGFTNPSGGHNHSVNPPSVFVQGSNGNLNIPPFQSFPDGGHGHGATIPTSSANGLTIPSLTPTVASEGQHNHSINFPQINGGPSWNVPPTFSSPRASHNHAFGTASGILNLFGPSMNPFLGPSNFPITPGAVVTSIAGSHSHAFNAPPTQTSNGFPNQSVDLPLTFSSGAGGHNHSLFPLLRTTTTFTFNPVPEPSAWVLMGVMFLGIATLHRRFSYQHTLREAHTQ